MGYYYSRTEESSKSRFREISLKIHPLAVDLILMMQRAQISSATPVVSEVSMTRARRTAFIARFIVLREGKRSRAHRSIEFMRWEDTSSAEDLANQIRRIFTENGDSVSPVERDIRRALAHANRSINFFVSEYESRATLNFIDALHDYERSNSLLFGKDEQPKPGGWRLPKELEKLAEKK